MAGVAAPLPVPVDPGRGVVRVRAPEELEWVLAPAKSSAGAEEPMQLRLRSVASIDDCVLEFHNHSAEPVRAIWLDFSGNEVSYTVIEPGTKRRYRTFTTHPWIIRSTASGERMMLNDAMVVVGSQTEEKVHIRAPPHLPWSMATHRFYPAAFKAATQALLLAHNRLYTASPPHVSFPSTAVAYPSAFAAASLSAVPSAKSLFDLPDMDMAPASSSPDCGQLLTTTASSSVFPPSSTRASSAVLSQQLSSSLDDPMDGMEPSGPPTVVTTIASHTYTPVPELPHPAVHAAVHPRLQVPASHQPSYRATWPPVTHRPDLPPGLPMIPPSPRSLQRAMRVLGWVVHKVRGAVVPGTARSPASVARAQEALPCMDRMADLPAHLLLHIVEAMTPVYVPQCITRGPPEARPNILPARLANDPAMWPPLPTPPQEVAMPGGAAAAADVLFPAAHA